MLRLAFFSIHHGFTGKKVTPPSKIEQLRPGLDDTALIAAHHCVTER